MDVPADLRTKELQQPAAEAETRPRAPLKDDMADGPAQAHDLFPAAVLCGASIGFDVHLEVL